MWKQTRLAVPVLLSAMLTACAGGPTSGPITLVTQIDFSSQPFTGTFQVTQGSQILGCSEGTFVDTPTEDAVHKLLTCESGSNTGAFTIEFVPIEEGVPWSVVDATGDFAGLTGTGEFTLEASEDQLSGVETFAGDIEYSP